MTSTQPAPLQKTAETLNSLESAVSAAHRPNILLGPSEGCDHYWSVSLASWDIYIRHPDYHLEPNVYRLQDGTIAVGMMEDFYLLREARVVGHIALPCRFYELIMEDANRIVLWHEIGFSYLSTTGSVVWQEVIDLIEEWRLDGDSLWYKTLEGEEGVLNIGCRSDAGSGRDLLPES